MLPAGGVEMFSPLEAAVGPVKQAKRGMAGGIGIERDGAQHGRPAGSGRRSVDLPLVDLAVAIPVGLDGGQVAGGHLVGPLVLDAVAARRGADARQLAVGVV